MPRPAARGAVPPAAAWDWVARQRLVWTEARTRVIAAASPAGPGDRKRDRADAPSAAAAARSRDVPDWSALLAPSASAAAPHPASDDGPAPTSPPRRDYAVLDTRAAVVAALREDYPRDPVVRRAVDDAVTELAFLGHRGGDLTALGVRTPPRGMRWWWEHLGGRVGGQPSGPDTDATGPAPATTAVPATAEAPTQLRMDDVLIGYGDPARPA